MMPSGSPAGLCQKAFFLAGGERAQSWQATKSEPGVRLHGSSSKAAKESASYTENNQSGDYHQDGRSAFGLQQFHKEGGNLQNDGDQHKEMSR